MLGMTCCIVYKRISMLLLPFPLFVQFSFSPSKFSATNFSSSVWARVFKFCIHIESSQVYWDRKQTSKLYFGVFFLFSISHSNVIYIGKFVTNISQELLHIEFCNLVQMVWIICCFMWKRTRLLLIILPLISSIFLSNFQISNNFISLFSGTERPTKLKVHTWTVDWCTMYTWISLLVLIYSFISSMFFLSNSKTLNFCHTFLWDLQSWNLIHIWAMGWSIAYTKYKQSEYTCSFIFFFFSVFPISKE